MNGFYSAGRSLARRSIPKPKPAWAKFAKLVTSSSQASIGPDNSKNGCPVSLNSIANPFGSHPSNHILSDRMKRKPQTVGSFLDSNVSNPSGQLHACQRPAKISGPFSLFGCQSVSNNSDGVTWVCTFLKKNLSAFSLIVNFDNSLSSC